jgi:hypothetical protein
VLFSKECDHSYNPTFSEVCFTTLSEKSKYEKKEQLLSRYREFGIMKFGFDGKSKMSPL